MADADEALFVNIVNAWKEYSEENNTPYKLSSETASNWFRNAVAELEGNFDRKSWIMFPPTRRVPPFSPPRPGNMYLFKYAPVTRATINYYDKFPLVLVMETYSGGFMGLNIHYLPIKQRIALFSKIDGLLNNRSYNFSTRAVKLTYEKLKPFTRYKESLPCIRRYRRKNVRGRLVRIFPQEWLLAMFLPLEQFVKKPAAAVWVDSMRRMRSSSTLRKRIVSFLKGE